ncbi:LysM peptidoglycan-binding domain-containing M23 family metallopeptidase [Bradyrhizobium sp.]|uniref:LysM peptidoglycan-binding domain-containing M23 family metallopeptidase n=1 Tax=Bradyrhizobium sp. TaxID=376 RepID=UPI001DF5735B|nr:LysM peptidoglycan-binding domain-containing M23 family metallopeptidase [Bradyrhizobium sp.]MBI5319725.1 LysM peptidoglycan-binding domain-containing M23 family metallopeptidase [Bradyrhizobium sp.]
MSRVVELLRSRRVPQVAALALVAFGFAGCSADTSTRFQASNFSNPFASQPEATASVPTAAVERRELPQYSRPHTPPPQVAAPQSYPVPSHGVSGGGRGLSSYAPPQQPQLETTGSVGPKSVAATRNAPAQGGTTIIVGTSDTLDILARRYNVSTAAILQANGYKGPRALSPGQQLIIPRPATTAAAAPAPAVAPPASRPVAAASSVHIVNRGDTLHSIARRNHVPVGELARANNLDQSAKLSIGMKLTVPGSRSAAAEPVPAVPAQQVAALAPPATRAVTPAAPQQSARLAQSNVLVEEKPAEPAAAAKPSETTSALPSFRWPVRGKVITGYGAKTNGKSNDGINVAVPEGTPVKAAEDGVVAYSGNELKGYGNLILVRHSNGYVTAYAHASELLVKRGDTIKRGQIIAKSGQSGEVGSPQLHFEIRKGSSPVDPLQFLNGA